MSSAVLAMENHIYRNVEERHFTDIIRRRERLPFCEIELHVIFFISQSIKRTFLIKMQYFSWTAAQDPSFWPYEWNTGLIASALATEKWRDGKWQNLINLNDAGGYDQFGACKGQVKIYEKNYDAYMEGLLPKAEIKELNLPGIRKRRWGPQKNENVHRTGVILGSMKDGTILEVGAFSSKIGVTQ